MRKFKTPERLAKIEQAVRKRQPTLKVVLENIHDPHNVSAIFRSCDAVGVPEVSLLYTYQPFPKVGSITSASASKWVEKEKFSDTAECYEHLRAQGFTIYASMLDAEAVSLYDIDLTKKVAIVMGNEHHGVSPEAAELADYKYYIPMQGMIQSLNVSVATAVTLYEALRQRQVKGMYEDTGRKEDDIQAMIDRWCDK